MKILRFVTIYLLALPILGQSMRLDLGSVYIQKKVPNEVCTFNDGNRYGMNGIYVRSATNFNGRNQYERDITLPDATPIPICISRSLQSQLGIKKYFIRWDGTKWVAGIITNATTNSFLALADLSANTILPKCGNSLTKSYIIGGNDCFCQTSMTLAGAASETTPRHSQTTLVSTQAVSNTNNVFYQAGNSISLENGFQVSSGGVFEAKIGVCN